MPSVGHFHLGSPVPKAPAHLRSISASGRPIDRSATDRAPSVGGAKTGQRNGGFLWFTGAKRREWMACWGLLGL